MKVILASLVLFFSAQAMSQQQAAVASRITCDQLKMLVSQGIRLVVGKDGVTVHNLNSTCGASHIFRTKDGLCNVFVSGTNPGSSQCFSNNDNGGA